MRILVTGGAGYIGSFTVRKLLERGHTVVVYDNLCQGHRAAVPAECLVVGDLKDIDHLDQTLIVNRIEAVVHFAAFAAVGESVVKPHLYYQNNLMNSLQLLERLRKHSIQRFLFSSTCAVYGNPIRLPLDEEHPKNPVSPYANTKLAFEYAMADYATACGIGCTALRYFNAAGASADGQFGEDHTPETHLIPLVLQAALGQRSHIDIYGTDYDTPDGTCLRDYIHVEDLAEAHALALEKITPGQFTAYNLGTGTGNSVRDVITTCEMVSGKTIAVKEVARRPGDAAGLYASPEKIKRELGWQPKYPTLKSIVQTAWEWHRTHPQGYKSKL
jgi:UDP-glucose-4-epimerase GalE